MTMIFKMAGWLILVIIITVLHYMMFGFCIAPIFSVAVHFITLNEKIKNKTMFRLCYAMFITVFVLAALGAALCCAGVIHIIPYPNMPTY